MGDERRRLAKLRVMLTRADDDNIVDTMTMRRDGRRCTLYYTDEHAQYLGL